MEDPKREVCARLIRAGNSTSKIMRLMNVGKTFVCKVKSLIRDGKSLKISHNGGRPRSKQTPAKISRVAAVISRDPRISIRKLSERHRLPRTTMGRLIKEDLSLKKPCSGSEAPFDPAEKRLQRGKQLINKLKSYERNKVRIFSDEKLFTANPQINRRNSRYLSDLPVADVDPGLRFVQVAKQPLRVMTLGVVASDGQKCPIIFTAVSKKVSAEIY